MRKLLLLLIILLGLAFISVNIYLRKPALKTTQTKYLIVEAGDGAGKILRRADSLNISISPLVAKIWLRVYGAEKSIAPGRYTVKAHHSRLNLLHRFRRGEVDYIWVTIPEGLTVNRTIEIAADRTGRPALNFLRLANDSLWVSKLALSPPKLEGYLFPETYKIPYYSDADFIFKTMTNSLHQFLDQKKLSRMKDLGFSVHELLTLASLIESETADRKEMKIISSVFHNRLKKKMLLQCDPTVIYAHGGLNRLLLLKDLKIDSPYNTYRYKGLPPGPINSPGAEAILASLYPDSTDFIFFVADVNGKHIFTVTNAEHEKARQKIRQKKKSRK